MANWCENDLYIMGEDEKVLEFIRYSNVIDGELDFEKFMPSPKGSQHDWHEDHWGTSDIGYKAMVRSDYDRTIITFLTRRSPPAPVIKAMAKRFPDLTFVLEYFEGGTEFCGGVAYRSKDECKEYDTKHGKPCCEWEGEYRGARGG